MTPIDTSKARQDLSLALYESHGELVELKRRTGELVPLGGDVNSEWAYEDPIYRFYHGSFKVYDLQEKTLLIVDKLSSLAPVGAVMNEDFSLIIKEGTEKIHQREHNDEWLVHTRPILEANFHARFFLDMAIKYGEVRDDASRGLAPGWAALLYLYGLRY